MTQFSEYKLTITDPTTNDIKNFVWPVVDRRSWAFCVKTELGEIWLESKHSKFGYEHDKVCSDQVDQYLRWLKFQLQNDINYFVEVLKVDTDFMPSSKNTCFKFSFNSHQWDEESNSWIIDQLKYKDLAIPKKLVDESIKGKYLAPFWYLKKRISAGGLHSLSIVKKVRLSEIKCLILNTQSAHNH